MKRDTALSGDNDRECEQEIAECPFESCREGQHCETIEFFQSPIERREIIGLRLSVEHVLVGNRLGNDILENAARHPYTIELLAASRGYDRALGERLADE